MSAILETVSTIKLAVELVIKLCQFIQDQRKQREAARQRRLLRNWAIGLGIFITGAGVLYLSLRHSNHFGESPAAVTA